MKNRNGITLIALVITVIILIILAGVAMSMITGNGGIFTKANEAATLYNQKAQEEADKVQSLMDMLEQYTGGSTSKPVTPPKPLKVPVTNANIGDYIDLGTNLLDTTILSGIGEGYDSATGDWGLQQLRPDEQIKADYRILYVEGDKVYAILADYLPNSTNIVTNSGIDGITQLDDYNYVVYGTGDTEDVANALAGPYTRSNNSTLVNALTGAPLADKNVSVALGPTFELIEKSYNTTNPTAKIPSKEWIIDYQWYDLNTQQSLYMSRLKSEGLPYNLGGGGYWLASYDYQENEYYRQEGGWNICYYGLELSYCGIEEFGLRPVVVLGADVDLVYNETREVWEVVTE